MAPRSIGSYQWGASVKLTLADDPSFNNILVEGIPDNVYANNPPDTEIFDESTPDGYKWHGETSVYRAGLTTAAIDIGHVEKGQTVALGQIETLRIIRHRNKILRDSGINLPVPAPSATDSEWHALVKLLAAANITPGNGFRYYYPAASYTYAYEPAVNPGESLAKPFRSHNWFLPTPGDMFRLGRMNGRGAFSKANSQGFLQDSGSMLTTGQISPDGALSHRVSLSGGNILYMTANKKEEAIPVVPMVKF